MIAPGEHGVSERSQAQTTGSRILGGGPGTFWHVTDVKLRRHRRRRTLGYTLRNVVLTHDFVIARKSRKDGETLSQGQVQGPRLSDRQDRSTKPRKQLWPARGGELVTETYSLCMPIRLRYVTQSPYISYRSLSLVLPHGLARVASAASWSGLSGRIVLVLVPAPG